MKKKKFMFIKKDALLFSAVKLETVNLRHILNHLSFLMHDVVSNVTSAILQHTNCGNY